MPHTTKVIEARPRRLRRPPEAAPPVDPRRDSWAGLSADLIDRFVDVMESEYGLSRGARRCYRSELAALDDWMQRTHGRTLAGARRRELLEYMCAQFRAGLRAREFERLLMCLQHFFRHLKTAGYRMDNAAARLCSVLSNDVRGKPPRQMALCRAG